MAQDTITVDILPDGSIKVTTDPISAPNHGAAEVLVRMIAEGAGGTTTRTKRSQHHHHGHQGQEAKAQAG